MTAREMGFGKEVTRDFFSLGIIRRKGLLGLQSALYIKFISINCQILAGFQSLNDLCIGQKCNCVYAMLMFVPGQWTITQCEKTESNKIDIETHMLGVGVLAARTNTYTHDDDIYQILLFDGQSGEVQSRRATAIYRQQLIFYIEYRKARIEMNGFPWISVDDMNI